MYPKEAWYCIGLFIFIVAVFHWISVFTSKLQVARRRQMTCNVDSEQIYSRRRSGFAWRHIPLGLINAYRVIAFRWTFEIGKSWSLTMAEVLMTVAYIVFLYIWTFINSASFATLHMLFAFSQNTSSNRHGWKYFRPCILVQPLWHSSHHSVPANHCAWD